MTLPDTNTLFDDIRVLLQTARAAAHRQVNTLVVRTNFEIGRRIVLHEQGGVARAEYGKAVLQQLSSQLTDEFGRGFSVDNLTLMRRFYLIYQDRLPNSQASSTILSSPEDGSISETASRISAPTRPFTLA